MRKCTIDFPASIGDKVIAHGEHGWTVIRVSQGENGKFISLEKGDVTANATIDEVQGYDFAEIERQRQRMCAYYKGIAVTEDETDREKCYRCPISSVNNKHSILCLGCSCAREEQGEAWYDGADAIMAWAAEHKEPKYPTWREWQENVFDGWRVSVCPKMFGDINCDGYSSCVECRSARIPAEIAAKLGIKPIEGDEK